MAEPAALKEVERRPVRSPPMKVRLVGYTAEPFNLAVASARTCYAKDFVFVGRLDKKGERQRTNLEAALPQFKPFLDEIGRPETSHERRIEVVAHIQEHVPDADTKTAVALFADLARQRSETDTRIAQSIYEAGHHTPFQHPTFIFAVEHVSRNVVESFLHNHTFYNSEQQSQRYVEMENADVHVPATIAASPEARRVYEDAMRTAWDAYHDLRERLIVPKTRVMATIGRIKGQTPKQIETEAEKKAQEMARYVIPIAAHTQLYHTVSGIVLLRYVRMCEAQSAPAEARQVVEAMVEEVARVDAAFVKHMDAVPRPKEESIEWQLLEGAQQARPGADTRVAVASGPAGLPLASASELVHCTQGADSIVAQAVREVTGTGLSDADVLARVMDPARNPAWNDTLNTWDHSPVLRALRHVHLTFRKRLSLTAYAQDQRHRLTPGTRPMLQRCLTTTPDVVVPDVIQAEPGARQVFESTVRALWDAVAKLRRMGVPDEALCYLLPNATAITYTQSGDLLGWTHKWRLRLCFNAQKEIFDASLAELRQAQEAIPALTRFIGPPCTFVAAAQPPELQDSIEACCPEGPRWCGVKVWQNFDAAKGVPKRPY